MMTAQAIGSLFVSLGLDSAAFTSGIKNVQSRMNGLAKTLGKAAAGMIATAAPAMAAMGVSAMNAATEIQRAAQLANAAPAEFQGWAAGAASVGIEQDKLADILKDVNDRVGDFIATGGGPMADFFERIAPKVGVTAEQFRKLSGPQALQLYVDSLEKANLNQQDMTFFMEAMASDSTALLPLLRGGGVAMAEYAAKAAALGAVMDQKTVASFTRAKQNLSEVQLAFTGFRNIIAAQVVPVLSSLASAFVTASQKGHWLGDMVRGLAELLPRIMAYASALVTVIGTKWVASMVAARVATFTLVGALTALKAAIAATGVGLIVIAVGELVYRFMGLVKSAGGFGGALSVLKDLALEVWNRIGLGVSIVGRYVTTAAIGIEVAFTRAFAFVLRKLSDLTTNVANSLNGLFSKAGIDLGLVGGLGGGLAETLDAAANASELSAKRNMDAIARMGREMLAPLQSLERLGTTVEETNDELADFSVQGGGLSQLADKSGAAKEKASALANVLKTLRAEAEQLRATFGMSELQAGIWEQQREAGVAAQSIQGQQIAGLMIQIDRMKQLKDATEEWRQSISSAFSNFITQGGSFKNVLSQIIAKLADMLAQQAFTGLIGAGTKGGGFLASTLKFLGFANGTLSAPGGLARVNERGGEIMNLPRGTQVIPHDISKRMANRAAQGGATAIQVSLSPELVGQIIQQAGAQSIQIVQANNRALPDLIQKYQGNPRGR